MYPIIIRELVNTNYSINVSCYSNIMCISGNLNKCTAVHYIIITLVSLYSQFPLDSQFCKQVKVFNTFNCNEFLQETVTHQKYCTYSFNMIKLIVEVPVENVYSLLELSDGVPTLVKVPRTSACSKSVHSSPISLFYFVYLYDYILVSPQTSVHFKARDIKTLQKWYSNYQ